MTVRELVIPFQRNKRSKSVTTAGRPAGRPLILTFLRYIEVDSLRASRSARNNRAVNMGVSHQKIICLLNPRPRRVSKLWREICTFMTQKITSIFRNFCTNSTTASTLQCGAQHGIKRKAALSYPSYMSKVNAHYERIDP